MTSGLLLEKVSSNLNIETYVIERNKNSFMKIERIAGLQASTPKRDNKDDMGVECKHNGF